MTDKNPGSGAASETPVKVDSPATTAAEATTADTATKEPPKEVVDKPDEATTTASNEPSKAGELKADEAKKADESKPEPGPTHDETLVEKLAARLPAVLEKAAWQEMWNVKLVDVNDVPTTIVLQKFINANNGDVDAAEKQLTAALEWRKKVKPNELVDKAYNKAKFDGLGYVTTHKKGGESLVITWNVYGKVKDFKATFGDVEEFIQWRAALMELGIRKLKLESATVPIQPGGEDPYQMVQVHDYLSVSFFRMDPAVKAASKETITQFSTAYPELLSHKYFVNVPAVMGWMFGVMKLFLSPATLRKFHPMSSGASLMGEVKCDAEDFPKEYGGKGTSIAERGETVKLVEVKEAPKEETAEDKGKEAVKEEKTKEEVAKKPEGTTAEDLKA